MKINSFQLNRVSSFLGEAHIVSGLNGLSFSAIDGVFRDEKLPGKYRVYLAPDEQVLEIYHKNHDPFKIILSKIGIRLAPKALWRILINGNATPGVDAPIPETPKIAVGTVQIAALPQGEAQIELKNEFGHVYRDVGVGIFNNIPAGKYNLTVSRNGYKTKTEVFMLSGGEELSKFIRIEEALANTGDIEESLNSGNANVHKDSLIVPNYQLTEKPQLIKQVNPSYPNMAKQAGIEGIVVLKLLLDNQGKVKKIEVLKSQPLLDDAAKNAAWQYQFTPGIKDGLPVKTWISVPIHFQLRSR